MSPSEKHKAKTIELLDKGMPLIWEHGFNGTSVNDLVKSADIPKGSFYFYFESKEDFVLKAIDRYFETHAGSFLSLLDDQNISPRERLLSFYRQKVKALKCSEDGAHGCMACNLGSEMAEHNEAIRSRISANESIIREKLVALMQIAQETKEIDDTIPAQTLVEFVENAGKGAMVSMKVNQSMDPIDGMLKIVEQLLLKQKES